MAGILDLLQSQLGDQAIGALAKQVGVDAGSAQSALNAALPVLLGAVAKNASTAQGAASLANALDNDHDGSLLDNVGGFLAGQVGNPRASNGAAILGHILGNKQDAVQSGLANATALNSNQVGQLLQFAAPLVMAALAKQKQQGALDAGGLAGVLQGDASRAQQSSPALSMLTSLLDRDNDGSFVDDLGGMLSSFLAKR